MATRQTSNRPLDLRRVDFGNEAADDVDPSDLRSYFVEQDDFDAFADDRNKLLVATARKGVGKSALIQWISQRVPERASDSIVVKTRGADLARIARPGPVQLTNPNDHISNWMVTICALINRHLANQVGLAFDDDTISLLETAELEGYKSRNLVGCLLERLQHLLDSGRHIRKLPSTNEHELAKRLNSKTERNVWLLVDDLDATFQNTKAESLSLATFFSACRYLIQDMSGVRIRVTMRTDVWALIRRYDESSDKVEQYVREILWHQKDFRRLLFLRITSSLQLTTQTQPPPNRDDADPKREERTLNLVFTDRMEWGDKTVEAYKLMFTLSYERPRWAIQLCKLAQESAVRRGVERIEKYDIDSVWGEYGAKRIADVVAEHKHQCPEVEELLNGFRGADRQMTRAELFDWINRHISNHMEPFIEGNPTRSPKDVAHFLYRIGFIVARSESESGGYEHYRFDQMPDFLTSRTNEDFNVKWEIHPCYRQALDIQKLDQSHRERFEKLRRD